MVRSLVFAFSFLLSLAPLSAADFDPKPIDEIVSKALKDFGVPGAAVVIVQDDKIIYVQGFGIREQGKEEKVTPDTVFAIASCSKAFTATTAAILVGQSKMIWDDPVRKHLDNFRLSDEHADREVTIRDLLSHRTGMPRHDVLWLNHGESTTEIFKNFGKANRSTSFRSTWEYSNVPFAVAGAAVGKVAGNPWPEFIQQKLFEPLGMKSTYSVAKLGSQAENRATPHYFQANGKTIPVEWDIIDNVGPAGCIASTANDMGQWLRFQLAGGKIGDRRLCSAIALKETHTPQMLFKPEGAFAVYFPPNVTKFTNYGLGWFVTDYRGQMCISHGGTLTGFRAQLMMLPEKKLGVFVCGNLRPSLFTETVAKRVLDHFLNVDDIDWTKHHQDAWTKLDKDRKDALEKRAKDRKTDTKASLELKEFVGKYEATAYGKAEVVLEGESLLLKWNTFTFRLDHHHFDTFTAVAIAPEKEIVSFDRSTLDLQFQLGTNGKVNSLTFLDQSFGKK